MAKTQAQAAAAYFAHRRFIYERDDGRCGICGDAVEFERMDIDHITPRMIGGSDADENVRASHIRCNRARSIPDQVRYGLRPTGPRPPTSPLYVDLGQATGSLLSALARHLKLTRNAAIRFLIEEAAQRYKVRAYEPPNDGEQKL